MAKLRKPQEPRLGLADLRPGVTIECMRCEQVKPVAGSKRFHSRDVCCQCVADLEKLEAKEKQ